MLRGLWKLTWIENQDLHARADGATRDNRFSRSIFIVLSRVAAKWDQAIVVTSPQQFRSCGSANFGVRC